MQIVKRNGETREYDVLDLFAGVGGLSTAMSEKMQEVCNNIQDLIDRIIQTILETFNRFFNIVRHHYYCHFILLIQLLNNAVHLR